VINVPWKIGEFDIKFPDFSWIFQNSPKFPLAFGFPDFPERETMLISAGL
jgi:hypothetical protein